MPEKSRDYVTTMCHEADAFVQDADGIWGFEGSLSLGAIPAYWLRIIADELDAMNAPKIGDPFDHPAEYHF